MIIAWVGLTVLAGIFNQLYRPWNIVPKGVTDTPVRDPCIDPFFTRAGVFAHGGGGNSDFELSAAGITGIFARHFITS